MDKTEAAAAVRKTCFEATRDYFTQRITKNKVAEELVKILKATQAPRRKRKK